MGALCSTLAGFHHSPEADPCPLNLDTGSQTTTVHIDLHCKVTPLNMPEKLQNYRLCKPKRSEYEIEMP
eukprot:1243668-Amphidinium_carterae.1